VTVLRGGSGHDQVVASSPRAEEPITILLVEDDLGLRPSIAATLLRGACDRVIEAGSAELALYACGAHAVDLIAVSAQLPGIGASGLCTELQRGGGPPIVAYRVGVDAESHIRWLSSGGADSLSGDDPVLLAGRCRSVLRRVRSSAARRVSPWHHHLG